MLKKQFKRIFNKYSHQTDGATAIEFSLLALPFMVLIFGILELAIVFFTTTSLQHNVTTHTRSIRVGDSTAICGEIGDLKTDICDSLNVPNCTNNLSLNISRINSNQFDAAALSQFQEANFSVSNSTLDDADEENDDDANDTVTLINPDGIDSGIVGDEILIIKAVYQHDLILPGQLTRLANFGLRNKRILTVTQAMRTEPFPNVTCVSDDGSSI